MLSRLLNLNWPHSHAFEGLGLTMLKERGLIYLPAAISNLYW